jgi:hypothetical protein
MGPLGAFFPLTLVTVQTNYNQLGSQVDSSSKALIDKLVPQMTGSGQRAFNTLVGYRNETVKMNNALRKMQVQASQETNEAINRVQGNAAKWQTIATTVRDLSADTLMVGAALLSGGAAVTAIGGTSVLKGSFTFEDKKLAGESNSTAFASAGLEASTDLVVGVIGIGEGDVVKEALTTKVAGAKLAAGVLVFTGASIDGMSEFVKATVDGKTVRQALIAGATRAGVHTLAAGLGPLVQNAFSETRLEGLSFPVTITRSSHELVSVSEITTDSALSAGADALVQGLSSGSSGDSAAWHISAACTYALLGNSDLVYVEQHAMRPARS